jgi:hypothetical protein
MGGSASLLQIPHDLLTETETTKYMGLTKSQLDHLQVSREVLASSRRRSHSEIYKVTSKKRGDHKLYEVPSRVNALLEKVGVKQVPRSHTQSTTTKRLISHIFECLEGLQHLVKADQSLLFVDESLDYISETQSVMDANTSSLGKLLHEMIMIYTLCGDTVKAILHSSPDTAKVEDVHGRLPLHVAVDRDNPWSDIVSALIDANPSALHLRDSGGRTPLHIAVDRQIPHFEGTTTSL